MRPKTTDTDIQTNTIALNKKEKQGQHIRRADRRTKALPTNRPTNQPTYQPTDQLTDTALRM